MRERFSNHTVISIVHKLESALEEFDVIALLDAGELREFGPPRDLLDKGPEESAFAALYESLVNREKEEQKNEKAEEALMSDEEAMGNSISDEKGHPSSG